ncbi:MAG: hypothetical protein WC976_06160 [Caldisericia bacterium]
MVKFEKVKKIVVSNPKNASVKSDTIQAIPKELLPLAAEARMYKSAEEFVKVMSTNYVGKQGDFSISPLEVANEVDDGYWQKITDVLPEERDNFLGKDTNYYTPIIGNKLTIYRATEGNTIRAGDYVTNNKKYATMHLKDIMGGEGNLLQKEISADELLCAGSTNEFLYAPKWIRNFKTKQQFIDFYSKVVEQN